MDSTELLSLFTDMTRAHTAYVERRLQPLGLHTGQGAIIMALGARGPRSQKDLAGQRRVSAATISVMLRRMERDGLVVRVPAEDGKGNLIALTDAGLRIYAELEEDRRGEPDRVFAGLSDLDLAAAERIFLAISQNLETLAPDPGPE